MPYVVGKAETQGVEEYFVVLHIAQTSQGFVQPSGDAVDTLAMSDSSGRDTQHRSLPL